MSAPEPEVRGRRPGRSQFKVPHSMPAMTEEEKGHRKEVLHKLLALRDELTDDMVAGQLWNTKIPLKQTKDIPEPRMTMVQRMTIEAEIKHNLLSTERRRALQEECLIRSREEVENLDKTTAAQNRLLEELQENIRSENNKFLGILSGIEIKPEDARILFKNESKSKQENNAMIENLSDVSVTLKSEIAKIEETLNKYKGYKNILFKLSPLEWQEAKALESTVPSHSGPQESESRQGLETLSSATNDSTVTDCELGINSTEHEELYFSDPQQLLDVVSELTEQSLSLIQTSTRVDGTLEELQQIIDTSQKKMKEDEEKLTQQVNDMQDRISKDTERAAALKRKVQLHDILKAEDQDVLMDALTTKVAEVHRCCMDKRLTHLSTLEKLSSVEYRMLFLLDLIENIPEESLETLRQIKDGERRSRLREEKLQLEREKQKERMKKCMQRSLGDSKIIRERKLMPRSIPVKQKIKVSDEEELPAKDELHDYLFTTEDAE
ncbi:cilia- and flagella-associated protein 100-like [Pempheris klunzingeri]|uniref:cilia- and flagella-associated protein 100-like n=1 Tax=Pempheris klunzingeri TaxID=3127111 RepID=UPI003981666B